jgi:DNA primase
MEEFKVIVKLLKEFLGRPKRTYESKSQCSFNCVECDDGSNKGNLEVNIEKGVYHCWSCGISGPLGKLIEIHGNLKIKRAYLLLKPEEQTKTTETEKIILKLPKEYKKFSDSNPRFIPHREALNYLHSRGITDEMIEKFQIGFASDGDYSTCVIIPSYDKDNHLNYFVARSWVKGRVKYKNPPAAKDKIIFGENTIDFKKDVYLTEGVFDMFFLDNAVPLLGKFVSDVLMERLYNECEGDIHICLDGDAWDNAVEIFHQLNGGRLYGKIKIVKLPKDKDVCDLRGNISDYYFKLVK